jgi:sugar lactone lactonase YvrE
MFRLKSPAINSALTVLLATASLLPIQEASANTLLVSTLSGTGGAGVFNNPSGVSVSPDGVVYVADQENFQIKKIVGDSISVFATAPNPAALETANSFCSVYVKTADEIFASDCLNSKVYKFAKSGQLTRTYLMSLTLPNRFFDWGGGLAVDMNGGIFLSDEHNRVILRIDETSGATSIYAGTQGKIGSTDGDQSTALFYIPRGLAVDSKGNLIVADAGNDKIRKITPQKVTSSFTERIMAPIGVAVDSQDSVYSISERWAGAIITKHGSGRIFDDSLRSVTSGVNGAVTGQVAFAGHSGFSIDRYGATPSNNLYISDWINHAVKVYSMSGQLVKRWGSVDGFGVTNTGTTNQIYDFPSQTFPLDDGSYLVADNFTIRHVSNVGAILKTTRLTQGCYFSAGITFTNDGTFFCTSGNKVLARFTDGSWASIGQDASGYRDGLANQAQFNIPEGLAVYQGEVYVADRANHRIRKITRIAGTKDFRVASVIGTGIGLPTVPNTIQPRATASFSWPAQIAIDGLGNLYVADGGVSSVFKTSLVQNNDLTLVARPLNSWPTSMTVDLNNTLFVATERGGIFQVKNNAMTYLGGKGFGNVEGSFISSQFNNPLGLSVDLKGNLLIADRDNQKVKKVLVDGVAGLRVFDSKALATYMQLPQDSKPTFQGMSQAQEKSIEADLIKNNQTGLISRVYQSYNKQIPERSISGLPLCQITIEKTINFDWGYNSLSTSNGCGKDYFLVTYKGFISWPGKGLQSRVFYAAVDDGMVLRINDEAVIDKWTDGGSIGNYPFNKSGVATFEGGKQYPIEIWYYAWTPPSNFKLYWSPLSANQRDETNLIGSDSFSPVLTKVSEPSVVITKPLMPKLPSVTVNLNFINLTVEVPLGVSSAILYSPEFGVTKQKPIAGAINGGFANFEVAINSKYAGKKGTLQVVSRNSAGESDPLKIPVTAPKVNSKPVAVKTVAPKPPAQARQPVITCSKGATKRVFEGTQCPPGYTKG